MKKAPPPNKPIEKNAQIKKTIDLTSSQVLLLTRSIKSYQFADIKLSSIGDQYYFTCTVTNASQKNWQKPNPYFNILF